MRLYPAHKSVAPLLDAAVLSSLVLPGPCTPQRNSRAGLTNVARLVKRQDRELRDKAVPVRDSPPYAQKLRLVLLQPSPEYTE